MLYNLHAAVEVHTVDTNTGVVLDTEVNVLVDTETEVAGLGEVALAELVLLDLEATLDDLLGLGATDGDVDGNLFVTANTEGTDGVAGLGVDGGLTGQLLENLCGTSKSVTRLADRNVQDELGDAELAHGVARLVLGAVAAILVSLLGGVLSASLCTQRVKRGCSSIYVSSTGEGEGRPASIGGVTIDRVRGESSRVDEVDASEAVCFDVVRLFSLPVLDPNRVTAIRKSCADEGVGRIMDAVDAGRGSSP